ncbi:hypothetical protein AB0D59_01140 [Streptomyces sp. NPDC048417]|uniref:hypothetical protein n=1 Tax=Streptomyces sp. NPDC048417 TaxID=3155387 RepID=UPI00341C2B3F
MTLPTLPGLLVLAAVGCLALGLVCFAAAGVLLLRHVLRGGRAVARVRALHRKASHGTTCVYCAHGQRVGYDTSWPCDTIRALDGEVPA